MALMSNDYRLKDFINQDLKIFSNLDNIRSIPSLIDGFKDSQRKAIHALINNGSQEIKVSQAASYAALLTHYNHGEVSMADTIVGLAQNFPGSNNVNLLDPIGQFGSILSSESSAHRYIFTKPSVNLRKYLQKSDDIILDYKMNDGDKVEPKFFLPIVPFWLLNGSVGIGTGHSVKILSRDVKKVIKLVKAIISGSPVSDKVLNDTLTPSFDGWGGTVVGTDVPGQWELHGKIEKINTTTLLITQLPITYDLDKFKSILISLMDAGKVKDFDNDSNELGFKFTVTVPREVSRLPDDQLKALFKLVAKVGENVTLWGVDGNLKRYDSVYEALLEFIEFRKTQYVVRKAKQSESYASDIDWIENKIEFIRYWNEELKEPHKKSRLSIELEMKNVKSEYFDRLFSLQISSLTMEKINDLNAEKKKIVDEKIALDTATVEELYLFDLNGV